MNDENKKLFLDLCNSSIKRNHLKELLLWLENETDFFKAPASTRFHGAYEGGLLKHSLSVYDRLNQLTQCIMGVSNTESNAVVALFHDVCKVNCYKTSMRNVKENNTWVQKPYYDFEEQFPFGGHGSKSVFLIQKFIILTEEEAVAINTHMSCFDSATNATVISGAYNKYPLAVLLSFADQTSTYIDKI